MIPDPAIVAFLKAFTAEEEARRRPGRRPASAVEQRKARMVAEFRLRPTATLRDLAHAAGGISTSTTTNYLKEMDLPTEHGERAALFSYAAGYEAGALAGFAWGYVAGLAAGRRWPSEEAEAELLSEKERNN